MRTRIDGKATREAILKAASQVFGAKGYNKATHAEISRTANVNSALINFHFGSKDQLYLNVWERVSGEVNRLYPMDGGVPHEAPAETRLRGHIRSLMNIALDPALESFHRILTMEFTNPTGLLDELMKKHIQKHRAFIADIMRDLLGPTVTEQAIALCEISVMSQCHMILPRPGKRGKPQRFKHSDVDMLTDHITRFSLAGIAVIKQDQEKIDQ